MSGFCEYGNEISSRIENGKLIDKLDDHLQEGLLRGINFVFMRSICHITIYEK
jgi:hypothetical protein